VIALFNEVVEIANDRGWLSGEHISVNGTLIQAWAGHKSFERKGCDHEDGSDFRGRSRSNHTDVSTSDPDARLYRKGSKASELRYIGHTLSDNRHGLIANAPVTQADGYDEREAAKAMIANARQAAEPTSSDQRHRRPDLYLFLTEAGRPSPKGCSSTQKLDGRRMPFSNQSRKGLPDLVKGCSVKFHHVDIIRRSNLGYVEHRVQEFHRIWKVGSPPTVVNVGEIFEHGFPKPDPNGYTFSLEQVDDEIPSCGARAETEGFRFDTKRKIEH
jgi:hypothetical protein